MSPYTQTTLNLAVIIIGTGAVAVILAFLWYHVVSPDNFDKDTAWFLAKMFGAVTIVMLLVMVIVRYT